LSANEQQMTLTHSGTLATHTKLKPGRAPSPGGFPRGMPPFPLGGPRFPRGPRFGPPGPEGVTINRQGEMLVARDLDHLPYLLGDAELLVIEYLPAQAEATWVKQRDIVVQERKSSDGPFPPMMFAPPGATPPTSQRGGTERTVYTIAGTTGDAIRVTKSYQLQTGVEAGGVVRFNMTGSGEFQFDTKEGLIRTLSMKYDIQINEPNVTVRVPVTLTYRLLTPDELAQHKKRAEEARAKLAAAAAKAKAPQPFAPGERAKLLADLKSGDTGRMRAAADRLQKAEADEKASEVAAALAPLLSHPDHWVQGAAAKAMVVWVTPEAESALIKASASENFWVRTAAIEALGKLKTEQAAEAVAAQMYRNRGEVAKALKAMGPVAETAAIGCLKDRDTWARNEACQVLAEIGGPKALKALKAYAAKLSDFEARPARNAIAAIERRLGEDKATSQEKPAQAAASPSKAGPARTRTWRDSSGVFEVQAALVRCEGDKVTLRRKDGKLIQVPLDKLSAQDRAYIEKQKNQPAGAEE
ncbi:MAG: SHD1 domain-containing protein, partial [Thermoguttaceae bacterium]|nr:SHD1 domain-containing protein [Thermoguttaceae bacterium]